MNLTQKERDFLADFKSEEKLCIDKYTRHASSAADPQLKTMFTSLASAEQTHLDAITQMEAGNIPTINQSQNASQTFTAYHTAETPQKAEDAYLCGDALAGEKHVSALYDTGIFEFCDEQARNVLNTIQKQEQGHGKMIYDYMSVNGMYA